MYDVIIIWAWSAGYPAGIYASRYKLKNAIIWWQLGGALATAHKVENYPWTISATWKEIMDNFKKHADLSGSEIIQDTVTNINKNQEGFLITTSQKKEYKTKKIILTTWNNPRKLWFIWEKEFLWKWVSYCATCDWMFFRNKNIAVVGWWNTALTEALYLSEICKKVYIIHRREVFRAENVRVDRVKAKNNIELVTNEEVEKIEWKIFLEKIILKSKRIIEANWIFIAIGNQPNTILIDKLNPKKDGEWFLLVNKRQETSIKWIYAAWDITTNSNKFKQTIMSAAEWCLAANSVCEDLL